MVRGLGAICVLLALSVFGCGGDSDSPSTISYRPFSLPLWSVGPRDERRVGSFLMPGKNGLVGSEPKPVIPDRPPPEFVVAVDLIDSFSPPVADDGDRVKVQYVGFLYDSKKKFVSSWDEGKPFAFTLGRGEVIEGWEEGIKRIEIGDRREIIVPPEDATDGSRMDAPSGATLVYVVEALAIKEKE
ncbi:MAG: FKBP-type peptidyl-prolyl cis-trans isomerase [Actinomycetota bacterium]|nr:FKBP-type peptidyl-prolyl cis-trans isomerase [Actinomycetota bacterium]